MFNLIQNPSGQHHLPHVVAATGAGLSRNLPER